MTAVLGFFRCRSTSTFSCGEIKCGALFSAGKKTESGWDFYYRDLVPTLKTLSRSPANLEAHYCAMEVQASKQPRAFAGFGHERPSFDSSSYTSGRHSSLQLPRRFGAPNNATRLADSTRHSSTTVRPPSRRKKRKTSHHPVHHLRVAMSLATSDRMGEAGAKRSPKKTERVQQQRLRGFFACTLARATFPKA